MLDHPANSPPVNGLQLHEETQMRPAKEMPCKAQSKLFHRIMRFAMQQKLTDTSRYCGKQFLFKILYNLFNTPVF